MNSSNLNFIAIVYILIFLSTAFLNNSLSFAISTSSFKNPSSYLFLSDSAKSDSSKKDSTAIPQLIEVGNNKKEVELKPQNELEKFAEDSIFLITDKPVQYSEGEMELFYKFVARSLTYPEEAVKNKQQDKIYVRFVVNKDGSVSKAESVRGKHDILKREAERVISLTKWIPAQVNGKNVRSLMTIPITFMLGETQKTTSLHSTDDEEVSIASVEEVATFDGGLDKLYNYISQNLIYPKSARRSGSQGRVILEFVVEKDGSLSNFKILQSVSEDCDAEAIRVLQNSPAWIPAKTDGKPVSTRISMPIVFKLDD